LGDGGGPGLSLLQGWKKMAMLAVALRKVKILRLAKGSLERKNLIHV
jgi:hypothetical protein